MEFGDYFRFALALAFVLGLIGILAVVAKRFGMTPRVSKGLGSSNKRLRIVDVASVDAKRRLVLVRRDDVEHLILLGPTTETVVETGIKVETGNDEPAGNRAHIKVAHERG